MRGIARAAILVVALGALVGGAFAFRTWKHVAHDNEFCVSCHSMEETFAAPDDSAHARLNCRDCHEQSVSTTLRQVAWSIRPPDEVGPHAAVDPGSCADCHITEDPDSTWQRISATAGHRVHLEADTSALQGVVCVTCHGQGLHRFVPADETCGQSGCHDPGKTEIVLGDMAGQTDSHCVTCHAFTLPVSEETPLTEARLALVPTREACGSCHGMEEVLAGLDPERDPHDAVCGTCHNPHTQEAPSEAAGRCAECHGPVAGLTPFHRGLRSEVMEDCQGCHKPHTFRVAGDDCAGCHGEAAPTRAPFPHEAHRDITCADCHTSAAAHGGVELAPRADCLACHHQRVAPTSGCARCHGSGEVAAPRATAVTMAIRGRATVRQISFPHGRHAALGCATCHTQGASLGVSRTCASCHESHHTATADCTACHRPNAIASHTSDVHMRNCAGSSCHETERIGSMTQGRNTCLACHVDQAEHRPGRACAACHRVTFAGQFPTHGVVFLPTDFGGVAPR